MADWDEVRRSFAGDQLRVARELRGLTQAGLARLAADAGRLRLTAAAVSQFELGDAIPAANTLSAIARALDVDAEFLTSAATDSEASLPAFFRSLRATPSRERKRAR